MSKRVITNIRKNKKAIERNLKNEWEQLLSRHAKPLERGAISLGVKVKKSETIHETIHETIKPKSLVTPGGTTAKQKPKVYTGEKMIGIVQMHKSNLVPAFKKEEIIEVGQMRRN